MQNSWNDVSGTTGGAKQQTQRKEPIDSVIDAFKDIVPADAILGSGWQNNFEKKKGGHAKSSEVASRSSWGDAISATSNQDESEKSWSSWGNSVNSSSWGNNSSWGNEENNVRNYSTNNQNSAYEEYQDVNKVTPNLVYADSREGYQDVNKTTDAGRPNQINNFDMYTNNNNYNDPASEWSERPQSPQQQQQHSYAEPPSPSESDTSTDRNSEMINPDDIKSKLSAWHSLAGPGFKEREDGIGGGQLHRRGKNFIPLDEATVLAIQQKGGINNKKNLRKTIEKSISSKTKNIPQGQIGKPPVKPPQKPVTPLKQSYPKNPYIPNTDTKPPSAQKASNTKVPAKTTVSQNQRQNTQPIHPNRTQQQTQQKPPSQSSQSSQSQPPWGVPKQPLRERSQQSQQPQPTQKSQQPQKSQQQSQKHSWDNPQLVNEPFWETSNSSPTVQNQSQSNTSSRQYANEVVANQSQPLRQQSPPLRQQSPARSPRPTKPVQDYNLPYIPPEFDSTPYRKQPSPSPVSDVPNGYNKLVTNEWGNNKVYEQEDYSVDDQRNEYYDESDTEEQENRFSDYNDRYKESEKNQTPRVIRRDRGQLLLTINVELEEGKTQAIEVHVNDEPLDLAKDFCDSWKVTNPVVMPALECLIREEKEKRLGV